MSCNSFPEYVRKRPHLHKSVLGFARRPLTENVLGFSLGFTIFGETAVTIDGHDRHAKPPIILDAFNISGLVLRFTLQFDNRQMKPPFSSLFSWDEFGGHDQRPGRRMKPSFWTRGLWSDSAVRSVAPTTDSKPPFIPDAFIFLGFSSAVYSAV